MAVDNLKNYRLMATPPKDAVTPIKGGSKGAAKLSSIKPQWRIEKMTEIYGEYGVGWYYEEEEVTHPIPNTGYTEVFSTVRLYVRTPDGKDWRPPAVGKGQAHLVSETQRGLFVDDEARKKGRTDALGDAMKCYGVAADVYMGRSAENDDKYAPQQRPQEVPVREKVKPISPKKKDDETITAKQAAHLEGVLDKNQKQIPSMLAYINGQEGRKDNPADDLNQLTYKEYAETVAMFFE